MSHSALKQATPREQLDEVCRGAVDLHVKADLLSKLERSQAEERPLRIKAGFDPSRPDLHLGHCVLLERMRRFQSFGHTAIFLIGDFTAMVGDPTGRNATRPALTRDEVKANAETYARQVFKVLDPERTEVRFNSEWLDALGTEGMIQLAGRYPLARMLERDDFKTRFREGTSISLHELLYPLLQGYDSVALKADVELGATDQLFNLLVGRQLMREEGLAPQVVMTGPILEGLDAREENGRIVGNKMSKSLDNYVGLDEAADQMFGKLMSISDPLMWRYYALLSTKTGPELEALRAAVEAGNEHPKAVKVALAREMAARFHGEEAAREAVEGFERRFAKKELDPQSLPLQEVELAGKPSAAITRVLADIGLTASAGEARRLVTQGGVRIDRQKVADPRAELGPGDYLVQVGKLRAARLRIR